MSSNVGIKIANGEFYPVIEEGLPGKKRLILTTVHDGQRSVQIDLYRSAALSMADAAYIGSLVVEEIAPKQKGEPSIELVISSDGTNELSAEAVDLDPSVGGERQKLSVSLRAMGDQDMYEVPDFELDQNEAPPSGLYEDLVEENPAEKPTRFPVVAVAAAAVACVALILVLLWLLVWRTPVMVRQSDAVGTTEGAERQPPATKPVVAEPAAAPAPAPSPAVAVVAEAPKPEVVLEVAPPPAPKPVQADRTRPSAPVKSYKVPRTIPKEGAPYQIRWGDTLWDISEAFYRNPWLYPRIARFNKIRNPDRILAGFTIRIPPQN